MDNVVQYFLDNPQPKYFTLKDIANRNKKSNDLKGEIPRIDYQHLRLGSFRAFMPKTYNLVLEIVENFISELKTDYYFIDSRNNSLIGDAIRDYFLLTIYKKIEKDETFRKNIGDYERDANKGDLAKIIKAFHKDLLYFQLEDYFKLLRMSSLFFITKNNQKEIMQKLGIYKPYKPQGNKYSEEREIIYAFIPAMQLRLIEEYGGIKNGKSDKKTAVYKAIKQLKFRKVISKEHDPDKVYDGFLKYNPNKVYQDLIKEAQTKKD